MFEALSDRFEGIFAGSAARAARARPTSTRSCARSASPCSRPTSTSSSCARCSTRIRERAVGARVHEALNPAQQVIKLVHEELIDTLGGETMRITYASRPPTVVLMAGLQGSGKTTTAAKLARWFSQQGRNPLLVGADLQRPAAVEQLRTLGDQVDVPVFSEPGDPVGHGQGRRRRGPPAGPRRVHRRHRRPPGHRRRADGPGPAHLRGDRPRLHVPRRRRHDRPGRRHRGRGLPRDPRPRRRHPHQARRRRPRRRRPVGQGGRGQAHRLRLHRREARGLRPVPPRPPRQPHPRHGRHAHPHREGRGGLREGGGRGRPRPSCSRAGSRSRTSSSRCSRSGRWARCRTSWG